MAADGALSQRPISIQRYRLTTIGSPMLKIRRSHDRLIFNMAISYLGKTASILIRGLGLQQKLCLDNSFGSVGSKGRWTRYTTLCQVIGVSWTLVVMKYKLTLAFPNTEITHWINIFLCRRQGDIDGLVQDFSIPIAKALGILQSCTKPSICALSFIDSQMSRGVAILGPVLLTLLRHVARILANGSAAFFESCDTIGWNSRDMSQKR